MDCTGCGSVHYVILENYHMLARKRNVNQKKDITWYTINFSGMHFLPVLLAGSMLVHQIDPLFQELWARLTLGTAQCNWQETPTSKHLEISYNMNRYTQLVNY